MRSKELRAKRAKLISDARALINGETVTAEQTAQFDAMMAEADELKARIDRIETAEAAEAELAGQIAARGENDGRGADEQRDRETQEVRVFGAWLRGGMDSLSGEDRAFAALQAQRGSEFRAAQSTQTGPAGGYLVPPLFADQILTALKAYFTALDLFDEIPTATGAPLPWPTNDDTAARAKIIGENTTIGTSDLKFGLSNVLAYLYATDAVLVPWTLMQDSFLDLDTFLTSALSTRFGRTLADDLTNGTGTNMPQGVCTAAGVGFTTTAVDIGYDDIIELIHSVDPAYRQGATFMFNDTTLKVLRKMKDNEGRPLWSPAVAVGAPDTFAGYAMNINQSMPSVAAGNKAMLFGSFKNYKFRNVKGMSVVRLNERYADALQTAFFGYGRYGGGMPTPGAAIQALVTGAAASGSSGG
ncbi:phage major capsid protein [Gluconobacter kondonii]|uniref:phage major capsid protein n=1 Tax=Gluconobacter kondonii TaxID=941463 RepID=UPI001B8DA6F0|nr:phage major capsid protein [Gluconobacter kondonii]MBS1079247.1 phage major capsid protein [Gluconobacter kondonii]